MYFVIFLIGKLSFEWYVVWCGSKDGYHSDMCSQEIGLHAQIMVTILDPIVNIIGGGRGLNDHSINMRIFILIMNKIHLLTIM